MLRLPSPPSPPTKRMRALRSRVSIILIRASQRPSSFIRSALMLCQEFLSELVSEPV